MNPVEQIVSRLNTFIEASPCLAGVTCHGLTRLIQDDKERNFPTYNNNGQGFSIMPDESKPLQIYHRLRSPIEISDEGQTFGLNFEKPFTVELSLYGIGVMRKFTTDCGDSNLDIALLVQDAMPKNRQDIATNLLNTWFKDASIDEDIRAIVGDEYGGIDKLDSHTLDLIAFRIDYTVSGSICDNLCEGDDVDPCGNVAVTNTDGYVTVVDPPGSFVCDPINYDIGLFFSDDKTISTNTYKFRQEADMTITGIGWDGAITNAALSVNGANVVVFPFDVFRGDVVEVVKVGDEGNVFVYREAFSESVVENIGVYFYPKFHTIANCTELNDFHFPNPLSIQADAGTTGFNAGAKVLETITKGDGYATNGYNVGKYCFGFNTSDNALPANNIDTALTWGLILDPVADTIEFTESGIITHTHNGYFTGDLAELVELRYSNGSFVELIINNTVEFTSANVPAPTETMYGMVGFNQPGAIIYDLQIFKPDT